MAYLFSPYLEQSFKAKYLLLFESLVFWFIFSIVVLFFAITAITFDRLFVLQLHFRYDPVVTTFRVTWVAIFILKNSPVLIRFCRVYPQEFKLFYLLWSSAFLLETSLLILKSTSLLVVIKDRLSISINISDMRA